MKPKTTKILYWTFTILFALLMLMDGIAGVMWAQAGQDVMKHLGFPMYALTIFGTAKILGSIAILQPKFKVIKEWAYAGFAINFIGAFACRALAHDEIGLLIPPLVMLGFMFIPYFLWKKFEQLDEEKYGTKSQASIIMSSGSLK